MGPWLFWRARLPVTSSYRLWQIQPTVTGTGVAERTYHTERTDPDRPEVFKASAVARCEAIAVRHYGPRTQDWRPAP
jgi:hypothetical protein